MQDFILGAVTVLAFIGSMFLFAIILTGAYLWLRFGGDGALFAVSKDFAAAFLEWKIKEGERRDMAEKRERDKEMQRSLGIT